MNTRRIFDPWGLAFGVLLPLLAAASGLVLTSIWESRLPTEIVTHWGLDGPDGYSTPMSFAWVFALVTMFVGGGCASFAALAQALLMWRRIMLVTGLVVTGLLSTLLVAVLWVQLDTAKGDDVELPGAAIGLGVLIGSALGVLGASLLRDYRVRVPALGPPDAKLPRGAAEPWRMVGGFGTVGIVVIAAIGVGIALLACGTIGSTWPLWVGLPVIVLVVGGLRYDVTIDSTGVRVRNFGLTTFDVDMDEIIGAKLTDVAAFKDFGGWGLRAKGPGRYGVITQRGTAVEIGTASGLTLTITTPQAEEVVGALNTWASQQHAER
ncbi:DUF1648 domain-containing protein [Aldersonia kunmingensis]|uniref:DUF1648 domain-containing protein n=1 Tax=Aldersonia kunmingensis TaxID=408066 RepID=UPI00082C6F4F|nr:DUF1648 domain-containing protein [Aldersonia kunmingensis]